MSVLEMITDSSVRQEVTATIDLDPERTSDHPTMGPDDLLFRPDLLMIHWTRENGSKWIRKDVTLHGKIQTDSRHVRDRALFKWWETNDLPGWVSEIVQEYKPKEVP